MAIKKMTPSVKPKPAVKVPMAKAKAPGIKAAAGKTSSIVGKGRKPAAPKMVKPRPLPTPQANPQGQMNPAQGWAGVMPGQVTGP